MKENTHDLASSLCGTGPVGRGPGDRLQLLAVLPLLSSSLSSAAAGDFFGVALLPAGGCRCSGAYGFVQFAGAVLQRTIESGVRNQKPITVGSFPTPDK